MADGPRSAVCASLDFLAPHVASARGVLLMASKVARLVARGGRGHWRRSLETGCSPPSGTLGPSWRRRQRGLFRTSLARHSFALPSGVDAPAAARRAIASLADLFPDEADDVCLLTSEMVTDSVRYAGGARDEQIVLVAKLSASKVRIEVRDATQAAGRARSLTAGGSEGLRLVDRLADRWGVVQANKACAWFEVRRFRPQPSTLGR